MDKVIAVYSGKQLEWLEEEGGIGYWIVQSSRIQEAKYILVMRNHRETWAAKDDGLKHGQAYMLAKISGCSSNTPYKGRKIILVSEYALLPQNDSMLNAWKKLTNGQRYPVAYLDTNDLLEKMGLDVNAENLHWQPFQAASLNQEDADENNKDNDGRDLAEVIAEAKEMIAHAADIEISQVNIQINF